jgi:Sec-independent protein secretion pathway component TatC
MWICGLIFGYNYLLQPLFIFLLTLFDKQITALPVFKIDEILPVLLGMLGLGGLRTFEKLKGVTK